MNWFTLKQLETALYRKIKVGQNIMLKRDFVAYAGGEARTIHLKREQYIMVEVMSLGEAVSQVRAHNTTNWKTSEMFSVMTEELSKRDGIVCLSIIAFYFTLNLVTGKYFKRGGITDRM